MVATAKALIVDDDADIRSTIRALLELETSLECSESGDAFEALDLWKRQQHDVVLVDYRIPGFHGIELARMLLAHEPQPLVIVFSAYLDQQAIEAAEHLRLPIVMKDQIRTLPRVIEASMRC